MNHRMIARILGTILLIEAALMLVPTVVSAIYGESVMPFLITIAILVAVSLPFVIFKPKNTRIYTRDGLVCVAASWILMSAFGALPFMFSGVTTNYIDALFETVSGFTTTGASILTHVEGLPYGILFWRSFTHWVGGMGVLVFMLALLPSDDGRAIHLMRAEVPGPTKGKIVPKLRQTARILYGIYIVLTVSEAIALLLTGMPVYDSFVNAFATTGTGGFSVLNASIAGYNNPAAEWVITVFMILCGINFNLFYFIIIGNFKDVLKNEELRTYALLCVSATTIIAINTFKLFENLGDCIRTSLFQVTTVMSTTGFATADFNTWPVLSKSILTFLMLIGACAGSTAGGLKVSRVIIIGKNIGREIKHVLRPRSVNVVRLDGEVLPEETVRGATNYFSIYIAILLASVLLVSFDSPSMETGITATVACLNNIGPGMGVVGPAGNYAAYSIFSKLILTVNMLVGRLEIFPMLILFAPSVRKNK